MTHCFKLAYAFSTYIDYILFVKMKLLKFIFLLNQLKIIYVDWVL